MVKSEMSNTTPVDTEYTPTLEDVRICYGVGRDEAHGFLGDTDAEFDRFIERVRAEAWDEGFSAPRVRGQETNPYRAAAIRAGGTR